MALYRTDLPDRKRLGPGHRRGTARGGPGLSPGFGRMRPEGDEVLYGQSADQEFIERARQQGHPARAQSPSVGGIFGAGGVVETVFNAVRSGSYARAQARVAGPEQYQEYLTDRVDPEEPYIGGFDPNTVTRDRIEFTPGEIQAGIAPREPIDRFARPLYRNGDEADFPHVAGLDDVGIRRWQSFFAAMGFRTGPSGAWTGYEMDAMRALMGMANGSPQGGMSVDVLRERILEDVQRGNYFHRELNPEGETYLPALLQDAEMASDLTGGGGGGVGGVGDPIEGPITETTTERQTTQFSMDQGMLAIRQQVAEQIGRAPTDGEVRNYVRDLNAAFREDPTIVTTVTTTDPITQEVETERTVDESGVEPEAQALEFAEEGVPQGERRRHQAGRYFDVIASELGM